MTAARGRFEVGLCWKDGGLAASALAEFAAVICGWAACVEAGSGSDVRLLPGVGPRAEERLLAAGIATIGELVRRTAEDLMECKNFGVTSLNEVREKLAERGLKLRGD